MCIRDSFNTDLDVKFSTYGVPMIVGEIRRYLRDNSTMRVSRAMRDTAYKVLQAKEAYMAQHQREPTVEEIAGIDVYKRQAEVVVETGQASVSMLQRRLKLGLSLIHICRTAKKS